MKRFASLLASVVACSTPLSEAHAEAFLDHVDLRPFESLAGIDFGANQELDRAWVILHYLYRASCPTSDGDCEFVDDVRVRVPGLAYDPATRQITYTDGSRAPVVCANVVGTSVKATDNCSYRVEKRTTAVDDGFDLTEVTHRDAILVVNEPRT